MALDFISFINMVGEEVSVPNLVAQMIDFYIQKLEVGETQITDFNEGSEIRNLLEGFAILVFAVLEDENEATKLPFISSSYGTFLDKIGENPFIDLPRITGEYARGSVTFTLSDEQESDVVIPGDCLLETEDGLEFVTDADCTIFEGETTADVGVTCMTMGSDGNISSNKLTIISDERVDTSLVSVNNDEEFINGAELEDDEDYRVRLLENVRSEGFGTLEWYTKLGEKVDGVHDVSFVSDASDYTRKVLVNGYSKPTPDSVLLETLAEYSDVENIILGHSFTVDKPSYYPNSTGLGLTFTMNVTREFTSTELTNLYTALVNGGSWDRLDFDGLNIGEDLTHDLLVSPVDFVDDIVSINVKITGQSSEFTSTSVNSTQVVKLGSLVFNQTVV